MAIVSRYSIERAVSVKKAVKRGLTQRLRDRVGMKDSDSSSSDSDSEDREPEDSPRWRRGKKKSQKKDDNESDTDTTIQEGSEKEDSPCGSPTEQSGKHTRFSLGHRGRPKKKAADVDLEMGVVESKDTAPAKPRTSLTLPRASFGKFEQTMPADAVLTKAGAEEVSQAQHSESIRKG